MIDPVNRPPHYYAPSGAELITVIEHLPYCRGARWLDIAERVGCAQDTARKRWRELQAK